MSEEGAASKSNPKAPLHEELEKLLAVSQEKAPSPAAASAADGSGDDSGADSEGGVLSDPEETLAQEERYERRLANLRRRRGLRDERTLKQAFQLLDCLIGQYKLNRTDEVLDEIADACEALGGDWRVKHLQSSAFCRWKQYRFRDALRLFLRQQEIVGASAALCENIGHTYSSLGELQQAEQYFERAVALLEAGSFGNRGGIYMGLGLVRERLGKVGEALPILLQSLEHYEKEHTSGGRVGDASILAKAHMSVGKALRKLERDDEAAEHMAEALRIFRKTCGEASPLTASAMGSLGKLRASQGAPRRREAIALLRGALERESAKDAFHLDSVWELLSQLKDTQMEQATQSRPPDGGRTTQLAALEAAFAPHVPLVRAARARLTRDHEAADPGTVAVFFKTAGELALLAQDYTFGAELLHEALRTFALVQGFDCSSLVEGCHSLLQIADANRG